MLGVDKAVRSDLKKVPAHRHHTQVLRSEFDLCVKGVKGPEALSSGFWLMLCCHVLSSSFFFH